MTEVACTVKSCFFNAVDEDICRAERIRVLNQAEAEDAWIEAGSMDRPPYAKTSSETLCKTFRPRTEGEGKDKNGSSGIRQTR